MQESLCDADFDPAKEGADPKPQSPSPKVMRRPTLIWRTTEHRGRANDAALMLTVIARIACPWVAPAVSDHEKPAITGQA